MKRFWVILAIVMLSGINLWAEEENEIDLDKIVVTPYRYEDSLEKAASGITVINTGEIKTTNANNVVDIFRPIPGVTVRDWYGNGTATAVDIAGFGEQAALNVLVLVDGRRINNVDLSGVDWKQISLDQIERIEVVRGGAAGVLYGDSASSGVINIITKKGSGKPKIDLLAQYGSYDTNAQGISLKGGINNKFSYFFNVRRDGTNGYRNNSFDKNSNFLTKLAYDFNNNLSAHFDSGFHASTFGMPASLTQSAIDQFGRRYSKYGDDHANGKDYYFAFGPKIKTLSIGNFELDFDYRQNDTDSYFLSSGLDTLKNKIETFGVKPKYTLGNSIFNRDNKLVLGIDFYRTLFSSKTLYFSKASPNLNGELNQYSDINKNSFAGYLQDEFSIFKQLALIGGYRYEFARYSFAYHDNDLHGYGKSPDQDTKIEPSINAFNAGLVYAYKDNSNIFFDVGKTFRFPQVDEFTFVDQNWQKQIDTSLKPQSAINYRMGIRHKLSNQVNGSLSLFKMDVKDEIYMNAKDLLSFGSWIGRNKNYDRTTHEGIEASLNTKINKQITLFGNYTFTKAFFSGGQYDNNKIPLVPQHKGSIGLRLSLPKEIDLNITGNYVGKRYFLNDQDNAYSQLNGYLTTDIGLSWHHKNLLVTFCVNNLLDKQYSEYAGVTVDNGVKFYYPNPERNFNLKINYEF